MRVRAYIGAQVGNYAGICTLSSPGSAIIMNDGNGSELMEKTTVSASATIEGGLNETRVYPNPFKYSVNIDFGSNFDEKQINIYNAVGQMLKTITTSDNLTTLDLSELNYGVYMMQVVSRDQMKTIRLVKN